jgi:hypothetical protein
LTALFRTTRKAGVPPQKENAGLVVGRGFAPGPRGPRVASSKKVVPLFGDNTLESFFLKKYWRIF